MPPFTLEVKASMPEEQWHFFKEFGGRPFPIDHIKKATEEIEELCHILEQEGVTVRRPVVIDSSKDYQTPDFHSTCGHGAMPR